MGGLLLSTIVVNCKIANKNCHSQKFIKTFSTGINIRNLHNIVFSSPSKSRIRTLQSIGRGLRKSDTKDSAILFDIADDFTYKTKRNYTLTHFMERINIYNEEEFDYEIKNLNIEK